MLSKILQNHFKQAGIILPDESAKESADNLVYFFYSLLEKKAESKLYEEKNTKPN